MKRIIIFVCAIIPMVCQAQSQAILDSLIQEVKALRQELHETDSINKMILDGVYGIHSNVDKPRFKMYQTENMYNLLKLDTRTGAVWQVQYRMKSVNASTVPIEYGYITGVVYESSGWDGRFELYPTKNMYTFILLDTGTGNTYQVQWGVDAKHRFMERLY